MPILPDNSSPRDRDHQRTIQRAAYLQENRAYIAAIDAARLDWDSIFPEFSIGNPGTVPDRTRHVTQDMPIPAKLSSASHDENRRRQAGDDRITELERRVHSAFMHWREMVYQLCEEWWPIDIFPFTGPRRFHPTRRFVAASILWGAPFVDAEDGVGGTPAFGIILYNPLEDGANPEVVQWRAAWNSFNQRLTELFEAHPTLTIEAVSAAASAAAHDGLAALRRQLDAGDAPHLVLRLHHGLSSSEWRALYPQVADELQYSHDYSSREQRAQSLYPGMSQSQIAELFGVDQSTVARWLRKHGMQN